MSLNQTTVDFRNHVVVVYGLVPYLREQGLSPPCVKCDLPTIALSAILGCLSEQSGAQLLESFRQQTSDVLVFCALDELLVLMYNNMATAVHPHKYICGALTYTTPQELFGPQFAPLTNAVNAERLPLTLDWNM